MSLNFLRAQIIRAAVLGLDNCLDSLNVGAGSEYLKTLSDLADELEKASEPKLKQVMAVDLGVIDRSWDALPPNYTGPLYIVEE